MGKGGARMSRDEAKALVAGLSIEEAILRFGRPFVEAAIGKCGVTFATAPKGKFSNASPRARRWPTPEGEQVTFPSKCEAIVFDRLSREVAATPGAVLYRQVKLALLTIAPNRRGVPYVLTVDFAVTVPGRPTRYVEAKTKLRSREWARGCAAARSAGFQIEEVDQ